MQKIEGKLIAERYTLRRPVSGWVEGVKGKHSDSFLTLEPGTVVDEILEKDGMFWAIKRDYFFMREHPSTLFTWSGCLGPSKII